MKVQYGSTFVLSYFRTSVCTFVVYSCTPGFFRSQLASTKVRKYEGSYQQAVYFLERISNLTKCPQGRKDPSSHSYGKQLVWDASGDVIFSMTARRRLKYPYDFRREARPVKPVSDHLARFERRRCLFLDGKWCYIIARTASSWCWHQLLSLWRCHLRLSRAVIVVFSARTLRVKKKQTSTETSRDLFFSLRRNKSPSYW